MSRLLGAEALVLGIAVASCSLDKFGEASSNSPLDASSTGGVFTGGTSGFGGFPDASTGGTDASTGGVGGTGGLAGSDSGTGGGGVDAGDSGTGGAPPVWKPSDFSNCVVWLDADDSSTLTLSGQSVTTWNSKCGSSSVASSSPKAPQHIVAAGKSLIRCDGTDDELLFTGTPVQASDYTLFFVVSKGFGNEPRALWSNRAEPVASGGTVGTVGFYSRVHLFQNTASPTTLLGNTPVGTSAILVEITATAGTREIVLNGNVDKSDAATGTATMLATGRLCADAPSATHGQFDLREVIAYDRVLTPTERQEARTELKAKWGL